MKNVLKPSPGSDLIPLGITAPAAPASSADAAIQKKFFGSGMRPL